MAISAEELRLWLDQAGYDVAQIDQLSARIGVDLLPILAGWAEVLAEAVRPSPSAQPLAPPSSPPWWRRIWNFLIGKRN